MPLSSPDALVAVPPRAILVVDDDPIMRELLCLVLGAEGHHVFCAESGEAALTALAGGCAVEVILSDVQMPGLTGPELLRQLRPSLPPHTLLLGMSGSEPSAADVAGFDAFLLKPFSTADFRAALADAGSGRSPVPVPPAPPATTAPLDENTYASLAAALPPAALRELYDLTFDDIATRLATFQELAAQGNHAALAAEAHALKGGCGMVGAAELAALAADMETAQRSAQSSAQSSGTHPANPGAFAATPSFERFVAATERLRRILSARFT